MDSVVSVNMKSSFLSKCIYLLVLNLIVLATLSMCRPWCQVPSRRNWRNPPPRSPPRPPPFLSMTPWRMTGKERVLPGRPQIILYQHENHNGLLVLCFLFLINPFFVGFLMLDMQRSDAVKI